LTFDGTLFNANLLLLPEFQYVGVPSNWFSKMQTTIQALGIPV